MRVVAENLPPSETTMEQVGLSLVSSSCSCIIQVSIFGLNF